MFSPDGRWISYTSTESGRSEVYVRPYPGPGDKVQISTNGGSGPLWSRDGRELFYLNGNRMMAVPLEPCPTLVAGQPTQIFERDYGAGGHLNFDVSPDGTSFVMIKREPPREIRVVLNWFEELKRLAPRNRIAVGMESSRSTIRSANAQPLPHRKPDGRLPLPAYRLPVCRR